MSAPAMFWYRTLGEEFGPVTPETIGELLQRGVLSETDEIRCGDSGNWLSIAEYLNQDEDRSATAPQPAASATGTSAAGEQAPAPESEMADAIRRATRESLAKLQQRRQPSAARRPRRARRPISLRLPKLNVPGRILNLATSAFAALGSHVAKALSPAFRPRRIVPLAVLALVVLAALIIHDRWYSPAQTLADLQSLSREANRLRQRRASESEWAEFERRIEPRRRKFLEQLERAASADDRVTLELLWAVRDALPDLLSGPSGEAQARFDRHLQRAARHLELARNSRDSITVEQVLTRGIIALDAVLVVFAVVWFVRRQFSRSSIGTEQAHSG